MPKFKNHPKGFVGIVSDGTAAGTKLCDSSGNEIKNVTRVTWDVSARNLATAIVELTKVPVYAVGELSKRQRQLRTKRK